MDQFYEPPKQTTRLDLHLLFPPAPLPPTESHSEHFVPFTQERDKLGRLISRDTSSLGGRAKELSLQLAAKRRAGEAAATDRSKTSDKTVEKIFKVHTLRNASSRSVGRLKLAIPQHTGTPSIGYYDTTEIVNKMKYNTSKLVGLNSSRSAQMRAKLHPQTVQEALAPKLQLQKMKTHRQERIRMHQKLLLNHNLPELHNFRVMQRLQMDIAPNFQRDHYRFKELMRGSLVLANQIRRDLQLQ